MTENSGATPSFGRTTTVAEVGEQRLIALIGDRLQQTALSGQGSPAAGMEIEVDSGDDAAVLRLDSDRVVISTDVLVEERHFRMRWSTGTDIGVKVAAANLADIAAMGAQPVALVVALVIPATTKLAWVLDLATGMAQEAARCGAKIVGGDISSGDAISIAATAIGNLPTDATAVTLAGAQVGDLVAIAGRLGWSAAGLAVLSRGFSSPKVVVDAHRQPVPDYASALAARALGATSMTDVSDGLVADLAQLARASEVAVSVDFEDLPKAEELVQASAALNVELASWILGGGEDHTFIATFPPKVDLPDGFTVIGQVGERVPGTPIVQVLDQAGEPLDLRGYRGYVHY